MKIYTKNGDTGRTQLFGSPSKILKSGEVFSCLGVLDEINAHLGAIHSDPHGFPGCLNTGGVGAETAELCEQIGEKLREAQGWLLRIGADVAGMPRDDDFSTETALQKWVIGLENQIDAIDDKLPSLKNFILPGGTPCAAMIHVARAVVRRGEREVVNLCVINGVGSWTLPFFNRLSDYLFVLARFHNSLMGVDDVIWDSSASS